MSIFAPRVALSFAALALALAVASPASAAWPPAKGADMANPANWPNDPDYASNWNAFSYLPPRAEGAPALGAFDIKLGASGMSVDRAWGYTTGRDDVVIAVFDSGIKWTERELLENTYLNAKELSGAHRPRKSDGTVCGGAGTLAGYDCNGDGRLTVSDYMSDTRISTPVPGDTCFTDELRTTTQQGRILGDVNRNCVFDAGDLITLFSDGIDDDADGFKDDISGWDWMMDDNDPYDDTLYGHGTGQANDSSAEANNMVQNVGICPRCRVIHMRVGDSFITDSNGFARGARYAVDRGFQVLGSALGTINRTAATGVAIDDAYARGAFFVGSMADENSRHHNMPTTGNHVLAVHSIRPAGKDYRTADSYVAFDACSNFGGQMSLSISASNCSSGATSRAQGIAGLAYSYSKDLGLNITPGELTQLFRMTADDIDVPESRTEQGKTKYYFSKPGFDQRFGYGRANAEAMMKAMDTGRIPPEVDLTSPGWFDVLYTQRGAEVVPLQGVVKAARAQSVDMIVEWAPGVQPDDSAFKEITRVNNAPGAAGLGGSTPLAMLDLRTLDVRHERDLDSPAGENDRSVTFRVRAVAHYPGFDVRGDARRVVNVINDSSGGDDKDLLPGYPIQVGTSVEASPKLVDLTGDGAAELILVGSDGMLHAWVSTGAKPVDAPGFPIRLGEVKGLPGAGETSINAPAVADIDGDGKPEVFVSTWPGTLFGFHANGSVVAGFPIRLPAIPSCPLNVSPVVGVDCMGADERVARGANASPVLVDLDKDGKLDVLLGAFDGRVHAYRSDGTVMPGYPVTLDDPAVPGRGRVVATPAVGDINGDGQVDFVVGTTEESKLGAYDGPVFAVDGRGTLAPGGALLPGWPVRLYSIHLFPLVGEGLTAAPVIADMNGDGKLEVIVQVNGTYATILGGKPTYESDGKTLVSYPPTGFKPVFGINSKARQPDIAVPLLSQPAVGDMDQDGTPDLVQSGGALSTIGGLASQGAGAQRGQHLLSMWSGKTGRMLPGAPMVIEDYTFFVAHSLADISGDGYPEAVGGNGGYFVHAYDGCGREPTGWPKFTGGWVTGSVAFGDMDGDGKLEAAVGTREGYVFAWRTVSDSKQGRVLWSSFHHDDRNTGNLTTPLSVGTTALASSPLVCPEEGEEDPGVGSGGSDGFAGGGGCSTAPGSGHGVIALLAAVAAGYTRRRHRHHA